MRVALAIDPDGAGWAAPHAARRLTAAVSAGVANGIDLVWLETVDLCGTGLADAGFGVGYARAEAAFAAAHRLPLVVCVRHDDAAQVAGLLAGGATALVADGAAAARACADAQADLGTVVPVVPRARLHLAADATGAAHPAGAFVISGPPVAGLAAAPRVECLAAAREESQLPSSLATPLSPAA